MGELGSLLTRAREARGLTLEDAERDTRISRRYLMALESEQFEVIPAPVYARGFLRSYSQYLGLDPQETLAMFPREDDPEYQRAAEASVPHPRPSPDRPVSLYLPAEGSRTRELFVRLVMAPRGQELTGAAEQLVDHADLSDLVAIDPGGIGLTSFAFIRAARPVPIRQLCGLVSPPTPFSMKAEEYPLARRLYVYGSGRPLPSQAAALLDFALSDAAQPLIAEAGFVDRGIETQGIDVQGARIANSLTGPEEVPLPLIREMLGELKDAERLSLTFRFNAGSSNLEARSQSEAERFARLLAGGAFAGKEILLVGFTDSVGDFEVNRGLAERRAQSVLDTLKATVGETLLASVPILVQSYGELTPVGCNETAEGRELNRRVEVWVRDRRS